MNIFWYLWAAIALAVVGVYALRRAGRCWYRESWPFAVVGLLVGTAALAGAVQLVAEVIPW